MASMRYLLSTLFSIVAIDSFKVHLEEEFESICKAEQDLWWKDL
jgi:hypothetical protein